MNLPNAVQDPPMHARFLADPRPVEPERPLPTDCCDGGCAVCVFDSYAQDMDHYREQLAQWRARHPESDSGEAGAS